MFVAMATTFALGAESNRLPACTSIYAACFHSRVLQAIYAQICGDMKRCISP